MPNVKSIEKAVKSLRPSEPAEFRRWFPEFDGAAWDSGSSRMRRLESWMYWPLRPLQTTTQARRKSFEAHRVETFLAVP